MPNRTKSKKKIIRYVKCNKFSGRREWAVMKEDEVISYHREKMKAFDKALKMSENNENLQYQKYKDHNKTIEMSEKRKKQEELKRDKKLNPFDYVSEIDDDSEWERNKEYEEENERVKRRWEGHTYEEWGYEQDYIEITEEAKGYIVDGYYKKQRIVEAQDYRSISYSHTWSADRAVNKAIKFMKKHNYEEE